MNKAENKVLLETIIKAHGVYLLILMTLSNHRSGFGSRDIRHVNAEKLPLEIVKLNSPKTAK